MHDALELLELGAAAVAMTNAHSLTREALALGALGLQQHLDRVRALHAVVVAEADRQRVWEGSGARNMADWLAGRTNTSYGDAASRVRLGEAFTASPELKDAVDNGDISAASAESLFDAVTNPPDGADLGELLDAVKGAGPRDAKDAAEKWRDTHRNETPEQFQERCHHKRAVRSGRPVDGMVTTTVVLPVLANRQFLNSISHVAGKPSEGDGRTTEQRLADGLVMLCDAYAKGQVVGGREKPTILITINADSFAGRSDEPGITAHGERIPAHVVRHMAEHANLQRVLLAGSHVLNLGREVRYATDAQYKALLARDGGCRWTGCHIPAPWCDADHLIPWENGGATDLDNLVLWCRHHHTEKHRPGVTIHGDVHDLRLQLIDGTIIDCRPRTQAAA